MGYVTTEPQMYPCNMGRGGIGVAYHEFINSNGAVICRYCGARPPAEPLKVTCEMPSGILCTREVGGSRM